MNSSNELIFQAANIVLSAQGMKESVNPFCYFNLCYFIKIPLKKCEVLKIAFLFTFRHKFKSYEYKN